MPVEIQDTDTNRTQLGGFAIREKIGEGGMGVVYRARQTSLDRVVALKILHPRLAADKNYIESFRREAQAAARLLHPNIIPVYDAGEADGLYYYAMEFVHGRTLYRWVQKQGHLAEKTVLDIAYCVAHGLKYAWDKERLIHCDVKPENIMVDSDGQVKICDLGLAKKFGEAAGVGGQIFGTPQYVSPEQARGNRVMDQRSDIYSLGMSMWYALTGKIPFAGMTPDAMLSQHLRGFLEDPRIVAPNISEHTCLILQKMLAKEMTDRYQNWDEVIRDLDLVRRNKPPQCEKLPDGKSTLKPTVVIPQIVVPKAPRRPFLIATIGALLLVIAAIVFALSIEGNPMSPPLKGRPRHAPEQIESPPAAQTPKPAADRLKEALALAAANPDAEEELAHQLDRIIREFPESQEAAHAQTMLDDLAARQARRAAEEDKLRAVEEQSRREREERERGEAARLAAEQAFGDFARSYFAALKKRDYSGAAALAKARAEDAALAPLKEEIAACETVAARLQKFWDSIPALAMRLTDRAVTLQGVTGTIAEAGGGEIQLEIRRGVSVGVEIAKLSAAETLELAFARPTTGELWQDGMWFAFAEGLEKDKALYMELAGRAGTDIAAAARLMERLLYGPREAAAGEHLTQLRRALQENRAADAAKHLAALRGEYAESRVAKSAAPQFAQIRFAERLSSVAAGGAILTFRNPTPVACAVFSPDGRYVFSGAEGGAVKLWDAVTGRELRGFRGHNVTVIDVAFSPDGRTVVTGSVVGTVKFWDPDTGRERRSLRNPAAVFAVAFSPDGRRLAVTMDRSLAVLDAHTGKAVYEVRAHAPVARAVAFAPDGKHIVTGGYDRLIKLWEAPTGMEVRSFKGHAEWVRSVAVSPDGKFILSGGNDRTMRLWDLASGEELHKFEGHAAEVRAVAFSPDGKYALSASGDTTIKLWDIAARKEIRALTGHTDAVWDVAFSPDGRFALSASQDKTLKLWKLWD
jgi:serine/threonine protein kinase